MAHCATVAGWSRGLELRKFNRELVRDALEAGVVGEAWLQGQPALGFGRHRLVAEYERCTAMRLLHSCAPLHHELVLMRWRLRPQRTRPEAVKLRVGRTTKRPQPHRERLRPLRHHRLHILRMRV